MTARVPQVVKGATALRPGHLGPSTRPAALGPAETCLCGLRFTRYKAHRQTGHHQRWARAAKRAAREAAA